MVSHEIRRLDPPLRLTRRGRVVVLVLLVLAASAASAVLFTTASRAEDPQAGPGPAVVVQPGDTLWDIAARSIRSDDNQAAVAELRSLNHLSSYDVQPGDVLLLPRQN